MFHTSPHHGADITWYGFPRLRKMSCWTLFTNRWDAVGHIGKHMPTDMRFVDFRPSNHFWDLQTFLYNQYILKYMTDRRKYRARLIKHDLFFGSRPAGNWNLFWILDFDSVPLAQMVFIVLCSSLIFQLFGNHAFEHVKMQKSETEKDHPCASEETCVFLIRYLRFSPGVFLENLVSETSIDPCEEKRWVTTGLQMVRFRIRASPVLQRDSRQCFAEPCSEYSNCTVGCFLEHANLASTKLDDSCVPSTISFL